MALSKNKTKKEKTTIDKLGNEGAEDGIGSKIVLALVTLLIIIIWLGIIVLLIKCDVGGFGSTVLRPLIKDVPYLNMILPEEEEEESTEYQYESIEDAVERIKELEAMLDDALANNELDAETILKLQEELAELATYKEEQVEFERIKEKWYEEVIYGTENVDIDYKWYKDYYESIDPENAEVLYKQVVGQYLYDEAIEDYVRTYSEMQAKEAAAIFDTMVTEGKTRLVADILINMNATSRAGILGKMEPENAAKITVIMEPDK